MKIVAIEEHFWDDEMSSHFLGKEGSRSEVIEHRLKDFGGERITDMDTAEINYSILSHGLPAAQKMTAEIAIPICRRVNDRLADVVRNNPLRFGGFGTIPTADPVAAADELERCFHLGFAGVMIHGLTNGEFIDRPQFRPIFERAQKLSFPIYMHPSWPSEEVSRIYFDDYLGDFPMLARAAWGYSVENGTAAVRLILSGIFDEYPNLKIILGHLGETLPFQLSRLDEVFNRPGGKPIAFRDILTRNFWVTTSGFFSTPALKCCLEEMGEDRVLFAVDWPFESRSASGTAWLRDAPIEDSVKQKIFTDNARKLLRLPQGL